jgi:CheY-like chemotaxis protein
MSSPGQGTTASLWFPAEATPAVTTAPTSPAIAMPKTEPLDVMVVDDDALVLLNTAAMLEDMGHTVATASSGAEALRLMGGRARPADLLITDHGMPGMSGLQLIEKARRQQPRLPAVLATGYAELPADSSRDHVRLAKPFFQRQLAEAVAAAVRTGRPPLHSV